MGIESDNNRGYIAVIDVWNVPLNMSERRLQPNLPDTPDTKPNMRAQKPKEERNKMHVVSHHLIAWLHQNFFKTSTQEIVKIKTIIAKIASLEI